MWRERREIMADNLARINSIRAEKAEEKIRLVNALTPQLPTGPLTSTQLRNSLRDAWNLTYDETITNTQAWNLVRASRRKGIFILGEDGTYTIHHR